MILTHQPLLDTHSFSFQETSANAAVSVLIAGSVLSSQPAHSDPSEQEPSPLPAGTARDEEQWHQLKLPQGAQAEAAISSSAITSGLWGDPFGIPSTAPTGVHGVVVCRDGSESGAQGSES